MWFILSIIALVCWSGSDLFSKIGCMGLDRYAYLKMATAVGVVFGVHAGYEIFIDGAEISTGIFLSYLPVSLLYIASMTIGYLGLRYIELSISSPICNSSGALAAVIALITGFSVAENGLQILGIVMVGVGVVLLGIFEYTEDEGIKAERRKKENAKYTKSFIALFLPLMYCLLDALGTFADSIVLEELDEDSANVAYELTFLLVGIICFIYVKFVKGQKFLPKAEAPKYIGAVFETGGQLAYIYAISDSEHFAFSAPIISSYCALSVVWSRIFLKEKLSFKHYASILLTVCGIAVLGLFD